MTLTELKGLLEHLDDETEWQTVDEFWFVWGPRVSERLATLITDAIKMREFAQQLLTSYQNFANDSEGCIGSSIEQAAKDLGLDIEAWLR